MITNSNPLTWPPAILGVGLLSLHAVLGPAPENTKLKTAAPPQTLRLLTNLTSVRQLAIAEAERGLPVRATGVVTYSDRPFSSFFLQDNTAGIWVELGGDQPCVAPGELLQLEAITAPGSFAPILTQARVERRGAAPEPSPKPVTIEELLTARYDAQWVELKGTVRSVVRQDATLVLLLASERMTLSAFVSSFPTNQALPSLVGALVRVRGVCGSEFNLRRQFVYAHMMVPSLANVVVLRPGAADPFSLPARPIRELFRFDPDETKDPRVRVDGTVTLAIPGRTLVIQDGGEGLFINSTQWDPLALGERIEVVGFPSAAGYTPHLDDAVYRRLGAKMPIEPLDLTAEKLRGTDFQREVLDARLVRITARLLDHTKTSEECILWVQSEHQSFNARLRRRYDRSPRHDAENELASLRPESLLELTGICDQRLDNDRIVRSFELWARSPADVRVLSSGSWWTRRHTLELIGSLGLGTLASLAWVSALRSRLRKQTAQLRLNETGFRTLVNATSQIVWTTNAAGQVVGPLPAWQAYTGQSETEVQGLAWAKALHPDDVEPTLEKWRNAVRDSATYANEFRLRRHDGIYRHFSTSGAPVLSEDGRIREWIGTCTDITERKEAEEALRRSEEKFRQIAQNLDAAIWMASVDMQHVYYVSPAYERIWGRPESALYANPNQWAEALLPEDLEAVRASLASVASSGAASAEFRVLRPDGEVRWVSGHASCLKNAAGEPTHIIGVCTDVTEQKRTRDELSTAQRRLLEASREAGRAEVATSILHNVGNVLNAVNLSGSQLLEQIEKSRVAYVAKTAELLDLHRANLAQFLTEDPQGRQLPEYLSALAARLCSERCEMAQELTELRGHIDHIKQIVAMQQTYAKIIGATEPVSLADVLEDALRINAEAIQRHHVRVLREFAPVPPVLSERHKILQILVNLISNAKYALDRASSPDKQLRLRLAPLGSDHVALSVTDNGVGIAPEHLTRIFELGFTTRKDGHGFGLHNGALAARELGGELNVQSEGPGLGATFTLVIPCRRTEGPL